MAGLAAVAVWPVQRAGDALLAARGRLFPFVPVCLGAGIGLWFALPADPSPVAVAACVAVALAAGLVGAVGPVALRPPAVALALAAAGVVLADWRAGQVAAPVLAFRYHGPVEGRIVLIDRNADDRLRLTLDRVVLDGIEPGRTPARIRIVLQAAQPHLTPVPGLVVMTTAHLSPPEPAVEPGAFDFRRFAWFRGLGAVGYARGPVLARAPPAPGEDRLNRLRARVTAAIWDAVPGDAGGFAAAVATGDRAGISAAATAALRDSNLSHILSISGMHMALLTAIVFASVRTGIALVPPLALRIPAKKVAAVVALGAATLYLALSGGSVPTGRAYVMVGVMLVAVLADRQALSLRAVAIAATLILLWQPEALVDPGFQMSFAATVALIAGFAALRGRLSPGRLPGPAAWFATLLASSILAGFASAPYAAAHFNRFADYGLIANLIAGPVMGLLVMPGIVAAAILAPLGLGGPAWVAIEAGCRFILAVAGWVAGLDGAVTPVPRPPDAVLPLLSLGGAWLAAWPGRARLAGLAPLAAAAALWIGAERPAVLIAADGRLAGVMGPEGRALSAARGAGFAARAWLEDDGDPADQATAAARPGFDGPRAARTFRAGPLRAVLLAGKDAGQRVGAACRDAELVILPDRAADPTPPGCLVIDGAVLARTGALALGTDAAGRLTLRPAVTGGRRWDRPQGRGAAPAAPGVTALAAAGGASQPP